MAKTLCDWSAKDIEKKIYLLAEQTSNPCFACRKCARVANREKFLCKPVPLLAQKHVVK